MAKEICISITPHETRLAILEDDQLAEVYYERENEYTLAGSVYKGRVTRVLPGMQSSFVDLGLERDAFLYVTDFLEEQEDSEEYETSGSQGSRAAEPPPASEESARGGDRRRGGRGDAQRPPESIQPISRVQVREEQAAATAALRTAQPSEGDREEKGDEESPQGTRRWRGRRGRRRGGMRAGVLGTVASSGEEARDDLPQTGQFALPEHGAPGGLAAPVRATSSDDDEKPEGITLQAAAAPAPDYAGEDRVRGRQVREDRVREDRAAREGREPRTVSAGISPVLPGESLSKYGGEPASASARQPIAASAQKLRPAGYIAPRPATQVEVVSGWDGGLVLPGESLSRYKEEAAAASVAPAAASGSTHPGPIQASADLEADPEEVLFPAREESIEIALAAAAESALPETVAEGLPGTEHPERATVAYEPLDAGQQTSEAIRESEEDAGRGNALIDAPTEALGLPNEEVVTEAGAGAGTDLAAEYEPEQGEASVRYSPPVTSELRLSQLFGGSETPKSVTGERKAPSVETVEAGSEEPRAVTTESAPDPMQVFEHGGETGRSTLDAGDESHGPRPEEPVAQSAESVMSDRLTSEAESSSAALENLPAEASWGTSEGGLDEPSFETSERALEESIHLHGVGIQQTNGSFADLVDQLQGFSPGSGLLEEEVIDEEEYDFEPMDAQADEHDLEELEEETLDGGGETEEELAQLPEESLTSQMEDESEDEDEEDGQEEAAAFSLVEVDADDEDEDEGSAAPLAAGEPERRDRPAEDRNRRGGRNGRRRGASAGGGGGGRRQSAQTQDLPIISDLLKQGQEILVQIAKEPIAKKGARITSHIALPGRFLVFMPTVSHVGVSRKIESDGERQRLKRILISEKGDSSGGFIVRTAAEGASEEELRADLRFLISLWAEIKQRADTAKAPSLLYHDLNLVERILRDQVSSNFSTIWVDTEGEYERIVRFLNRFQPSLVRRVKLYTKETPLFEHFGITDEISKALKSKVWLKSGGSIVINQTEALVAIDINTGKYVGKTARLEDTIVKTNLDAIPEIVRQIRLRDLGGIIVIDFIDMDERKNRHRVLAALEEAMKVDRAPSKVLQFNDFGLVAITRKRVKQSLERTLSVQCETCSGTGMVKSPVTVCNEIYIELRKMQKHLDGKDVMLRVNPEVVKQLKGGGGRWINEYEEMIGKTIIIKSDPSLHPEQFDIQ